VKNQVVIIQKPEIDFNSFLSVASKVLGYNPAAESDQSAKKLNDSERLIACLQSMKNPDAKKFRDYFLEHINLSVMLLALEADMLEITEICASMPCISTETLRRDVFFGIITGNLQQWKHCVAVGCSKDVSLTINNLFSSIYEQCIKVGFHFVWSALQIVFEPSVKVTRNISILPRGYTPVTLHPPPSGSHNLSPTLRDPIAVQPVGVSTGVLGKLPFPIPISAPQT